MTVKTTLVPGAPWPEVGEWPVVKEKTPSKVKAKATDANYEKWKKKDALVTGADLGLSIKKEIQQKVKVKKPEVYKRPDLAPKEFFIFQKAKASK